MSLEEQLKDLTEKLDMTQAIKHGGKSLITSGFVLLQVLEFFFACPGKILEAFEVSHENGNKADRPLVCFLTTLCNYKQLYLFMFLCSFEDYLFRWESSVVFNNWCTNQYTCTFYTWCIFHAVGLGDFHMYHLQGLSLVNSLLFSYLVFHSLMM